MLYATYGNFGGAHVYRSIDGGATWQSIDGSGSTGLPDIPVHSIVVDPDDSQRLYLGTDLGVMVSHRRRPNVDDGGDGFRSRRDDVVVVGTNAVRRRSSCSPSRMVVGRGVCDCLEDQVAEILRLAVADAVDVA